MCTVAFTGYRPEKMPFIENKKDEMYVHFREQELKVMSSQSPISQYPILHRKNTTRSQWASEQIAGIE